MFCQCVSLVQLYHPRPLMVQGNKQRLIARSILQGRLCSLRAISSGLSFDDPFKPLSSTYLHLRELGQHLMTLQTPHSLGTLSDQPQPTHVNLL